MSKMMKSCGDRRTRLNDVLGNIKITGKFRKILEDKRRSSNSDNLVIFDKNLALLVRRNC